MQSEFLRYYLYAIYVLVGIYIMSKILLLFSKRLYCTQCGAMNVRKKMKSNYGCIMSWLDMIFLIGAFFTFGLTLIGCLIIHCCVKRTVVCQNADAKTVSSR